MDYLRGCKTKNVGDADRRKSVYDDRIVRLVFFLFNLKTNAKKIYRTAERTSVINVAF